LEREKTLMEELTSAEPNLRTYLQVLRRRFLWVIALAILAVAASVAINVVQTKKYSASSLLLVRPAGSTSSLISGIQQTITPTDILTELQLLASAPVKMEAAKQLGFKPSIVGSEVGQTNVISVTASAKTASLAARAANAYAKDFVAQEEKSAIDALISGEQQYQSQIDAIDLQIQSLSASTTAASASAILALTSQVATLKGDEAQLEVAAAESPGGVELVSLASPPKSPSSPRPFKDGAIALAFGLLLGLALALLVDYFDDNVYTKATLEKLAGGVPVMALIPKIKGRKKRTARLIVVEDPNSPVTEAYRSLRATLLLADRDATHRTILVTSPSGNEGKTSTVANLGVILANSGKRVVVVGCDLRQPRLGSLLGLRETPGFASIFVGQDDSAVEVGRDFRQPRLGSLVELRETPGFTSIFVGQDDSAVGVQTLANIPGLAFIGTGPIPPNAAELLGSPAAAEFFGALSLEFDVVLIDSPSLLVSDALVLSTYADSLLLVAAAGETKQKQMHRALQLLGQTNALPAGIVLNKVARRWRTVLAD
jgi:Mrp family chromosome partitioning ATPase/capsular polysaccharide biosynthesis protein